MQPLLNSFDRVFVLGSTPAWLNDIIGPRVESLPASAVPADASGIVPVEPIVTLAASAREGTCRALVVTTSPLRARGTRSLFGYADSRHQVALVSTARLTMDADAESWMRRVENVCAHELGHLDGLGHCTTPGCLMQAVRTTAGLDRRGLVRCGRCPRVGTARRAVAVLTFAAVCTVAFAGLDQVAIWLKPDPVLPFACGPVAGHDGPRLHFNGVPIVSDSDGARAAPLACRSTAEANALNHAFQQLDPAGLTDVPPPVQHLLRAKGRPGERCPGCHLERPADTRAAWRFMRGITP